MTLSNSPNLSKHNSKSPSSNACIDSARFCSADLRPSSKISIPIFSHLSFKDDHSPLANSNSSLASEKDSILDSKLSFKR